VAYPFPQASRVRRQPTSIAGVKMRIESGLRQTDETDEQGRFHDLDRPESPASLLYPGTGARCQGVALFTGQWSGEEAHQFWICIERGERLAVVVTPLPEHEPRGRQLSHSPRIFRSSARSGSRPLICPSAPESHPRNQETALSSRTASRCVPAGLSMSQRCDRLHPER
jgi:hypothetical protein